MMRRLIERCRNLGSAFLGLLTRISNGLLFGCGFLIVGSAVVIALFIERKDLAIIVAVLGTGLGTAIMTLCLPKMVKRVDDEKIDQIKNLVDEQLVLTREIERLRSARMSVDRFQPMLRLSLLEMQAKNRDISVKAFSRSGSEIPAPKEEGDFEYVGMLEKDFTASFGVDLTQLRLIDKGLNTVVIRGLRPQFQGFSELKTTWRFREIRLLAKMLPLIGGKRRIVLDQHPKLQELIHEHESELQARINQGVDFQHLHPGVLKMAKEFLALILVPLNKEIEFDDSVEDGAGTGFLEYLKDHNEKISGRLRELEERYDRLLKA